MSKCLDGNLVDVCCCWRWHLLGNPDETSHKGDTHAYTNTHLVYVMVTHIQVPHHAGAPQTPTVTMFQLSHLEKSVWC